METSKEEKESVYCTYKNKSIYISYNVLYCNDYFVLLIGNCMLQLLMFLLNKQKNVWSRWSNV